MATTDHGQTGLDNMDVLYCLLPCWQILTCQTSVSIPLTAEVKM